MTGWEVIAKAIGEVAGALRVWIEGTDARRLKYRTESAMQYIFVDEKVGQYKDVTDERREELKLHFRKRVFDEG